MIKFGCLFAGAYLAWTIKNDIYAVGLLLPQSEEVVGEPESILVEVVHAVEKTAVGSQVKGLHDLVQRD